MLLHKKEWHYRNLIGLNNKRSYQVGFNNRLRNVTSLIGLKHAQNQFLRCFKSTMVTDQTMKTENSFIKSQFTYCPLIWMFCTKHSTGRINSINEQCLRLIQQNYVSDFEVLLENVNEKPVHQKFINSLWLRFTNTWMAYLLISWVRSLNSDKIPKIWEIFIYLNLRLPEQKSLA